MLETEVISRRTFARRFTGGVTLATWALMHGIDLLQEYTNLGLIRPNERFHNSQAFRNQLTLDEGEKRKIKTIAFGDSNFKESDPRSANVYARLTIPGLANKILTLSGIEIEFINYALNGYTLDQTFKDQVAREGITNYLKGSRVSQGEKTPFIYWFNLGGNDLLALLADKERVERVDKALINDLSRKNIEAAVSFAQDLRPTINQFGINLRGFLVKTTLLYPDQVRYFMINGLPNFGLAPTIAIYPEGSPKVEVQINNPLITYLAWSISILMNNQIADAIDWFNLAAINDETGNIFESKPKVAAINLFDFDRDCFGIDQHFSPKGRLLVAQRFLSRIGLPNDLPVAA